MRTFRTPRVTVQTLCRVIQEREYLKDHPYKFKIGDRIRIKEIDEVGQIVNRTVEHYMNPHQPLGNEYLVEVKNKLYWVREDGITYHIEKRKSIKRK